MLLVNVNTKQFIPSAGSNFIQPVESRDQIIYGTRVEVRFQLYNPDGTVFALNESDTFCCAGDINFIHTDDLMFYSGHEMCRIIDAAQGVVGVTIDATSDSFAAKATSQNTRMYVQLKRHVAGDTLGDTVLQDIVYAQPAVMTTEGAPASSDPEYMTAAATLALLRTAPVYQFSVDGETNWHDQQDIASDRFYRERRNGGEWGPAIELIEGKTGPTGAAAGFGTPHVTVETLPAGSDATASVAASGDNTAKVFNFNFGIPKGADGKAGAGDMLKSVYDTDDDGIVDHAVTADAVGATTAAQIADAVGKAHTHVNKTALDKFAEADGKLTYGGEEIGGASNWNDITSKPSTFPPSEHTHAIADVTGLKDALENAGTVKSVNGQLPDESGNVTIETGGAVDESRLLPENAGADELAIKRIGASGIDGNTHLMLHFDEESGIPADSSQDEILVTANDTAANAATAKFGKARNLNNSYLSLTCPAMATGTGDFTYEGWFYFNELNKRRGLFGVDMGLYVALWGDNTYGVAISRHGSSWDYNHMDYSRSEATATQGVWQHIALVRNKGNVTLYLNGNSILSFDIGADTMITGKMGNNPFRIGYPLGGMSSVADFCDEFRFSTVARWTRNFTPPEKAYVTSAESWDPISMEGLRDELSAVGAVAVSNPANGDIPCFDATATIGGGNDANTVALLHFDDAIKDEAAGNAAPISITKQGVATITADDKKFGDGSLYFNSGRLLIPVDGSRMDAEPWVASVWFKTSSTNTTFLLNQDKNIYPGWSVITDSNGLHWHVRGDRQGSNHSFPTAEWNWMAVVKDDQKHLHFYLNGVKIDTYTNSIDFTVPTFGLGGMVDTSDSRNMTGYVDEFRLQFLSSDEITQWTGTSITVPDAPYSKPQTVGEWGKLNKSELALKSDLPGAVEWHHLPSSSVIMLDRANGELQKITLTQNCTLTAPVLDADHPTLLLQIQTFDARTVHLGSPETVLLDAVTGVYQIGWMFDGATLRRYPVVEVQ